MRMTLPPATIPAARLMPASSGSPGQLGVISIQPPVFSFRKIRPRSGCRRFG